jgi:hypothetical protein
LATITLLSWTIAMHSYATTILAPLLAVFLTRAGLPKTRYSRNDKLTQLNPGSGTEATLSRIAEYRSLFAFRFTNAIVTKRSQGPRAWTAYRGFLGEDQIVHHLLADRIPGRSPVWYGARSFQTSLYLCLDVDADRSPEQLLAENYSVELMDEDDKSRVLRKLSGQKPRPSYADRCALVERALRRIGINPENPRSVLIQRTPSGGRHYYVFFDAPYSLDQYHALLHAVGLRHVPGEIEFYPSPKHGLRLPFGHNPGQPHDPRAWIQFIDDYRNHRIIRYSLAALYENLEKHQSSQYRRIQSTKRASALSQAEPPKTIIMGMPQHAGIAEKNNAKVSTDAEKRFFALLDGIHSHAEAEELMTMGILVDGTRTKVLNHLVAHLIWFKHLSADDAASFLTAWAMSPRHASKDIAGDLARGTNTVAKHIAIMCRWYAAHKKTSDIIPTNTDTTGEFARQELNAVRSHLNNLAPDDQTNQAHFLLHFLRFAKRHGSPDPSGEGWSAAPAVRQVIRKWPGCHHMNYKVRMDHAIAAGVLQMTKEKWQRPNGKGRARTYCLAVPVVSMEQCDFDHPAAMAFLTNKVGLDEQEGRKSEPTPPFTGANHESEKTDDEREHRSNRTDATAATPGDNTADLRPARPRSGLESHPRECNPQPHATPDVPRQGDGASPTLSATAPHATQPGNIQRAPSNGPLKSPNRKHMWQRRLGQQRFGKIRRTRGPVLNRRLSSLALQHAIEVSFYTPVSPDSG